MYTFSYIWVGMHVCMHARMYVRTYGCSPFYGADESVLLGVFGPYTTIMSPNDDF